MKQRVPLMIRLTKFLVGFKLTPMGRIAVLGIFISAIGGITVEIPIYQIFCGVVCLFGIIETTGMLLRPHLEVSVWLPGKVTAGDSVTGYVTILNKGWLPACDIMCTLLGLPKELRHVDADLAIGTIPAGQNATLPMTIQGLKRGDFIVPEARIHSTFPFNLMRFGKARAVESELRVLPAFVPLEYLALPFSQNADGGGLIVDARSGNSPEFVGNRDYISGEPVRRLDFRAWARVGRPVVREFQDEFSANVAIILDTYRSKKWKPNSREQRQLEAIVSLTAAIAHQVDQMETVIAAFLAGSDLYLFQPSAISTHFESVLDILSVVEFTKHDPLLHLTPILSESLESIAITLCLFIDWDETRERLVREVMASGSAVRVLIVTDRELTLPIAANMENIEVLDPQKILSGEVQSL